MARFVKSSYENYVQEECSKKEELNQKEIEESKHVQKEKKRHIACEA